MNQKKSPAATAFIPKRINTLFDSLLEWLIPSKCILCTANFVISKEIYHLNSAHQRTLCQHCIGSLSTITNACSVCNTPIKTSGLCGVCIKNNRYWDCCYAAFEYNGSIKKLISNFKYYNNPALGKLLGNLLYKHIVNNYEKELPDYLLAVPMHRKQLQHRGFNQSFILCQTLSKSLNVPVINLIKKVKKTPAQKDLTSNERKKSLKNSFQIEKQFSKNISSITKIALIDDVMTTGSTATEISKLLKKSGISVVEVWVLART